MKHILNSSLSWLLILILVLSSCRARGPENLPKFKKKFKAQIASFESQKEKTDDKVADGVVSLSGIQAAIANAQNVDKEFNKVYTKWKKVDKQVEGLNSEYEKLKSDADNLFQAMEDQTAGLNDAGTRQELTSAIQKSKSDYFSTLSNTEVAIEKLRGLHGEALDVIKGLEVAVAIGQISELNSGLKNIEDKVASIMADLNTTIAESKDLYEKRIGAF